MRIDNRHIRGRSRRGNMPFAMVAVILLMLGSAYGITAAHMDRSADNAERMTEEMGTVDDVIERTGGFVERGLGEIIFGLSSSASEGTLEQRADKYAERARAWMDFQFPLSDCGVTVHLESFETELTAQPLKLSDSGLVDGCMPSYLVGSGSFTARYAFASGTASTAVDFETDATCALPLVAGQGSLFKNAVSGPGSPITQMVGYQLTCLAQYRVLNGYGALNAYGEMGTASILTEDDVAAAYSNALKIVRLGCFRIAPDGIGDGSDRVDLADLIAAPDGYLDLDLSAVYAQAIASIADDLALQWIDYLYGNKVMNGIDWVNDLAGNAWDSLKGFLGGKDCFSAAPYLECFLADSGLDAEEYRHLRSGESFEIVVPGRSIADIVGKETQDLAVGIGYPDVDLMGWPGIKDFKRTQRHDSNGIREWFTEVINASAAEIAAKKSLGIVRVRVDATDDESLLDTVCRAVGSAVADGMSDFERIVGRTIGELRPTDPFHAGIYEVVRKDAHRIYGVDGFRESAEASLAAGIAAAIEAEHGTLLDGKAVEGLAAAIVDGGCLDGTIAAYTAEVDSMVDALSSLNGVEKRGGGVFDMICKKVAAYGMSATDSLADVPGRMISLCAEIRANAEVNACYGSTALIPEREFVTVSEHGEVFRERISAELGSSPRILIGGPNANLGDCMHYVGPMQSSGASYCTVFSVSVRDTLVLTLSGSGPMEAGMGLCDSRMTEVCTVELDLKVPVMSAWALQGVGDYRASNTILSDAWEALMEVLAPIIEPLRKILAMMLGALEILASSLMKCMMFVTELVQKLYEALMEPLERLRELIEERLEAWLGERAEKALEALEWIVNANLSKQTVGFSFMGFTLTVTLNLASLSKSTKTLATVSLSTEVSGVEVSGSITIKQKGEGADRTLLISGSASLSGKDWQVTADIDPLMKSTKHMLCMSGTAKGVEFDIVMPEVVSYHKVGLSLRDVSGLGTLLSNIPLGTAKVSIDLGLELKYNAPFRTGLVINEFESNPPGTDAGNEWVELYNASTESIDLEGYTLRAGSNASKVCPLPAERIRPGGRLVVDLPGQFLNNSGSAGSKSGEYVLLADAEGRTVDKTPAKKDTANDDRTWQRVADASTEWVFEKGTRDSKNCGGLLTGAMVRTQLYAIIKDSASSTMRDMGKLTSTEDLSEFFRIAAQNVVTSAIEMLSECLVEASVYVSVDVSDLASAGCVGFRAALMIDSGFAEEGLKCLVGEIEELLFKIENPYGLAPKNVLYDNTYLDIKVYTGMATPRFLKGGDTYPEVRICVDMRTNLSGLDRVIGGDTGRWKAVIGLEVTDCPSALIPSVLGADKEMHNDLLLVKATFREAA